MAWDETSLRSNFEQDEHANSNRLDINADPLEARIKAELHTAVKQWVGSLGEEERKYADLVASLILQHLRQASPLEKVSTSSCDVFEEIRSLIAKVRT